MGRISAQLSFSPQTLFPRTPPTPSPSSALDPCSSQDTQASLEDPSVPPASTPVSTLMTLTAPFPAHAALLTSGSPHPTPPTGHLYVDVLVHFAWSQFAHAASNKSFGAIFPIATCLLCVSVSRFGHSCNILNFHYYYISYDDLRSVILTC